MFEQSLFNQEMPAEPTQEGEFLYNYELKNWNFSARIYKIIAASAIFNLLTIFVVGQTSLLTMKGCDSPFVGRVCQVLDTVYVGSMLFGTDREYVDAMYDKTDLEDAEITYIDVSNVSPPLSYPEGYFQIANPVQYAMLQQQAANPAPFDTSSFQGLATTPSTSNDLVNKPAQTPTPNNDVVQGNLPGSISDGESNPTIPRPPRRGRGNRKNLPNESPDKLPGGDKVATDPAPTPLSSEAVKALEINKKPLVDFADTVVVKWAANEIDLNQDFTVVLNGVLTKDGKLDREKSVFDTKKQKGDQKMIDIAKSAIEAVGDSGFLTYLQSLGVEKITMTLVQGEDEITAAIVSSQKSPERAKTISSGMNNYISIGKMLVKDPSDERTLLEGASVTAEGANFVLNFKMPKAVAHEIITRKLKEAQAKKMQQPQPNGTSLTKPNDNTARK